MELRSHPAMCYLQRSNWPPVWTPLRGPGTVAVGEIGLLRHVNYDARYPNLFHLVTEHQGRRFLGTLAFDDTRFCWYIMNILRSHTSRLLKDIGGLEISYPHLPHK